MDYAANGKWVNKDCIEQHLQWNARPRPQEYSPYISVFDNLNDAHERAMFLVKEGHRGVFVAVIKLRKPYNVDMELGRNFAVPFQLQDDDQQEISCAMLSTENARRYLNVDRRISQLSEWLFSTTFPAS
ncbi:hypothetical protein QBC34DRAFT_384150 [Podospora aff. communis PSN243]|uniref:Uncharacterized protein n=1 Tax=Podospora aff. communis PSN243 TaxID=3040156 RepID=A0AAV9GD33_9PEZI|nr:hypothetical protein QBC34DRAFT_384150 [Podospora aff. communis PSN243]